MDFTSRKEAITTKHKDLVAEALKLKGEFDALVMQVRELEGQLRLLEELEAETRKS